MKAFNYYQPTRLIFGCGKIKEVGKIVSSMGRHCLLVTTPGSQAMKSLYKTVTEDLEASGIEVGHFDGVVPNPTTDVINAGSDMAKQFGADVVLGLGGGSSMDTAKAISLGATHEGRPWDYRLYSNKTITDKRLPIVAISTTSGTGSQVTPVAVLTNTAEKCKFAIANTLLCPSVAIIDPELMLTVPSHVTASTGFDVFAHAFESYIHRDASPYTDLLAMEAMRLVIATLPKVMEDPSNQDARTVMAWADTLGGLCIANAGTTLPHGIGMAIGGHAPHVMHGEALAGVYPEFLSYTREACVERFAAVARLFQPGRTDEEASRNLRLLIENFLGRIGMLQPLSKLGVPRAELAAIADDAVKLPDYTCNPKVATRDEIFEILQKSF